MEFSFEIEEKEGYALISMEGNLMDKNTAQNLLSAVHERTAEGDNRYILDLTDLRYMNSSGINVLINILTRARNLGGDVVITGVSPKINSLLVITKLNSVFKVSDTLNKAEEMIRE
jgi:anti-sigma B factor antagonist